MPGLSLEEQIATSLEAKGFTPFAIKHALSEYAKYRSTVKSPLPWCQARAAACVVSPANCPECVNGWIESESPEPDVFYVSRCQNCKTS